MYQKKKQFELPLDYTSTPLYPDLEIPTAAIDDLYTNLYQIHKQFHTKLIQTNYHYKINQEPKVERYSDRYFIKNPKPSFHSFFNNVDTSIINTELLSLFGQTRQQKLESFDLSKLDRFEKENSQEESEEEIIQEESEDDENDYGLDYYDEEMDAFGDDDAD